ncbi:MAG: (Fe-S)-binding protein [Vicinamibacterales bacterium]
MDRSKLLSACVHCGFCLPSCPTYALWGQEMDSPRGRIHLMNVVSAGRGAVDETFTRHIDACLGCMACVPACPSGVQYGTLIEGARAEVEQAKTRPWRERMFRALLFRVLPYAARVRAVLAPAMLLARVTRGWAPLALARQLDPRALLQPAPPSTPAAAPARAKVGVLLGCVQRAVMPSVNDATVRVLAAEGCHVEVPREQGCCGALSRHAGRLDEARVFARRTIDVFERAGVDRVVVNAAGCGSSMKEYGELFEGDPAWETRARAFGSKVVDVTEWLSAIGPRADRHPIEARVAYHDACHLAHAQGIRQQPRDLLRAIPGITLLEAGAGESCCGSAGIHNLVQPEAAGELGDRAARRLANLDPDLIASGNPGCTLQIAAAAERLGRPVRVLHPIELVDLSIRGRQPSADHAAAHTAAPRAQPRPAPSSPRR